MAKIIYSTLAIALLANATIAADDLIPRTITVSGQGTASGAPDMATINTGVTTKDPVAKEALARNSRAMKKIIELLKSRNIGDKDIQTSGFSVYPEYRRQPRSGGAQSNVIEGYRVSNNVSVKVRNISRLGEILDALVEAGSNQISGVSFSVSEPRPLLDEARKQAVDDARGRAELYAAATGVRVGKVISISEQAIQTPRPQFQRMAMAAEAMSVPIARGEQDVNASINIMYELLD